MFKSCILFVAINETFQRRLPNQEINYKQKYENALKKKAYLGGKDPYLQLCMSIV